MYKPRSVTYALLLVIIGIIVLASPAAAQQYCGTCPYNAGDPACTSSCWYCGHEMSDGWCDDAQIMSTCGEFRGFACEPPPPPTGRWKVYAGVSCYWEPSESGANECDPDVPIGAQPTADANTTPEVTDNSGFSGTGVVAFEYLGGLPSCRAYETRGNVGYISLQTNPAGYLSWGSYMYIGPDNYGWWWANLYVNGALRDAKSQVYPPHGSLPPTLAPPGSVVSLGVFHIFWRWFGGWSYLGEGLGWRWNMSWIPYYAGGNATCMMPG